MLLCESCTLWQALHGTVVISKLRNKSHRFLVWIREAAQVYTRFCVPTTYKNSAFLGNKRENVPGSPKCFGATASIGKGVERCHSIKSRYPRGRVDSIACYSE